MRAVRVSENFIPVSEFKAQAADWLRKLAETDARTDRMGVAGR